MRTSLARQIRAAVPAAADQLISLIKPQIRISLRPMPMGDIAPGASRVGGLPDLPPQVPWPHWRGGPLDFLAQFNLAELAR